jgi:hypothetical protein
MLFKPLAGLVHFVAEILDPGQHGVEAGEVGTGGARNDAGQGRFARARRAVKNQVSDPVCQDGPP